MEHYIKQMCLKWLISNHSDFISMRQFVQLHQILLSTLADIGTYRVWSSKLKRVDVAVGEKKNRRRVKQKFWEDKYVHPVQRQDQDVVSLAYLKGRKQGETVSLNPAPSKQTYLHVVCAHLTTWSMPPMRLFARLILLPVGYRKMENK